MRSDFRSSLYITDHVQKDADRARLDKAGLDPRDYRKQEVDPLSYGIPLESSAHRRQQLVPFYLAR